MSQAYARQLNIIFTTALLLAVILIAALPWICEAQTTTRVSQTSSGVEGNGESFITGISGDGRYVVFSTFADNLIPGGTNGWLQVLRHDANNGSIIDTSLDVNGDEAVFYSWFPTISADGNRVGFTSNSYNLVTLADDDTFQAYVRDVELGITLLASCDPLGNPGNDESYFSAISGNGRYMAFASFATNLVPNDTNGVDDVYVKDLQTGVVTRVSVDSSGNQGNGSSSAPQISYDGRYTIFASDATNLVPNDTNGTTDIFVHDLITGITERVSVSSAGAQSNGSCDWPTISWDGRYAAFECNATNLVTPNTASVRTNVYIRDRIAGKTYIESVSSTGVYGNGGSSGAVISGNGKYITFNSDATNLTSDSLKAQTNVFIHKISTGQTSLVSKSTAGKPGNGSSDWQTISGDGRIIAFASNANNLVPNDTAGERDIFVREQGPPFTLTSRIDCGGPAVGTWSADSNYVGGKAFLTTKTISNIGTEPQLLYQTCRTGKFNYTFPKIANGAYRVNLYFEEPTYTKSFMRIFNVYAEGSVVIPNLDVFTAAGGKLKGVVRSFTVNVQDSNGLTINFVPVKLDAIVSGIEVLKLFE